MTDALSEVLKSPGAFAWGTLKAFRKNQGLLLAGAVAYYALLAALVPPRARLVLHAAIADQRRLWLADHGAEYERLRRAIAQRRR